ncbi:MAG: hypothetical protein UT67_C0002G0030 [Candidatus Magasanikbacteria bacterium GW2011_GWA2_40_10]|uniref:Uncharacterized protein n=1 Tax=Candidatus Magasanikbacteria bacterium GW2011_GWA2_40_10 TaxID=1619037 RepID=A0A0G0QDL5_9BACT|nr:MAG: hypothetical protein UT67_C0002G0030 [Candidatus Magasanikbacteria bacterium GW2011_GWA2_40_10]
MAHKDIRIPFEIKGRRFEAVGGFPNNGKLLMVDGDKTLVHMLRAKKSCVIRNEDATFISEHFDQLPDEFKQDEYELVTGVLVHLSSMPKRKKAALYFTLYRGMWEGRMHDMGYYFSYNCLVLCRLP